MRTPRTLPGLVALLVVLVGAGCAPLEPKSKKAEGAIHTYCVADRRSIGDDQSLGEAL